MISNIDNIWPPDSDSDAIKQRKRRLYRVRMVLAIGVSYAIDTLNLVLFWLSGMIEGFVPVLYFIAGLIHVVLFSALHWFGISERCKDPQLVLVGMLYALVVQMVSITLAPNMAAYFLAVILIIFGFGLLRQPLRQALWLWLVSCITLGLVLYSVSDEQLLLDIPHIYGSAAIMFAFATVLLRTLLLGHYATFLRLKLFERHLHLGKELEEREQFASELERHKSYLEKLVKLRTEDLTVAMESAEKANLAKSMFLSNMSHEFRTPLSAILGYTQLVQYAIDNPDHKKKLDHVIAAANKLNQLVERVLDLTELEANRLTLESKPFKFESICEQLTPIFNEQAKLKGLTFRLNIDPSFKDVSLLGDPLRLQQVISELVSNAIKFSEQGEVLLDFSLLDQNIDYLTIRISVTDSGIGMPIEDQSRIFDLFEQADNTTTRRYHGTGLGLAFSNRLLGLMGSELHVTSKSGSGSRIEFTIKLNMATPD